MGNHTQVLRDQLLPLCLPSALWFPITPLLLYQLSIQHGGPDHMAGGDMGPITHTHKHMHMHMHMQGGQNKGSQSKS